MYYTACANPASERGDLATFSREMHVRKSVVSYPCVHAEKMCVSIFIAGPVRPLNSVIKLQVYLKCALQISRFFSVTRTYVHVRRDVREALY